MEIVYTEQINQLLERQDKLIEVTTKINDSYSLLFGIIGICFGVWFIYAIIKSFVR